MGLKGGETARAVSDGKGAKELGEFPRAVPVNPFPLPARRDRAAFDYLRGRGRRGSRSPREGPHGGRWIGSKSPREGPHRGDG